ncbi:MAG: DUF1311 domain-containing protein [Rhodobacteraceae bacterium]|nr:DUF1311 domain-containing protein [Paracoccaceae bacterium]
MPNTRQTIFTTSMLLLLTAVPAQALDCNNANTTYEMRECEAIELQKADDLLNQTYKKIRNDLDDKGKTILRDAQRAWIVFRDAECERLADMARGGSIAPLIRISCITSMTQQRVTDLRLNPMTGELED